MKKYFFIAVAALALTTSSCKKDDPVVTPPSPEASPILTAFLVNTPTTLTTTGSGGYEYGTKFSVTKNGKITKLGCKMPQAGTYRVTLWDASVTPAVVLAQSSVTQAAGTLTFNSITAAAVTTGKDYFVSIWSNGQWYEIRKVGGGNFTYPITQGSISIKGYSWIGASVADPIKFPTNNATDYIAGIPDFEFQAN
jgi:hypothetical protein